MSCSTLIIAESPMVCVCTTYCVTYRYLGGGVGHDLGPAVGESHLVAAGGVVAIALLVCVEVAEAVVVLDGVGVLVHGRLVRVGHGGGHVGGGGGAVGGHGGGGGGHAHGHHGC